MGESIIGPGWVKTVTLAPPSLSNNTADADRLLEALKPELRSRRIRIDYPLLKTLPGICRRHDFRVRCVLFQDRGEYVLLAVLDPDGLEPAAGLALDIGTTTVDMALVDLWNRDVLGKTRFTNPQVQIGPDVLTRIHHAETEDGLERLNRLLREALNAHVEALCRASGIRKEHLFIVSAAGNTAMTHLFLGLCPRHLIREPYIPVVNRIPLIYAAEIGIRIHPAGRVFVFPNIGSYFGGDLFAGILYSRLHEKEDLSFLVDVGTNAEAVLGNREWLMACAGAAGPALEGGVAKMGMAAAPGVIDKVTIDPSTREIRIRTIGNRAPKGICGSGLIDLAAQLFLAGMIDIRGKWVPTACAGHLREQDLELSFVLVPGQETETGADLVLGQADLDSLIRSKAAMYTILETLARSVGVSLESVVSFYVAGAFGSVIDPESAISIGMIPDLPRERFHVLGNSALGGALQVLLNENSVEEVERIRDRTTYLELNVNQDFMNRFSAAKFIPHTDMARFPTVAVRRSQHQTPRQAPGGES